MLRAVQQRRFLRGKRGLILDRDKKFTTEFRHLLEHAGTDVIRLPHRSPNLNAVVSKNTNELKTSATGYLSRSARCAPVNGLAGCYVSTIG